MASFPVAPVAYAKTGLHNTNNLGISILSGALGAAGLSVTVADATAKTAWPAANFVIRIEDELIFVTSRAGNVLTIAAVGDRGFGGTAAVAHADLTPMRVVSSSNFLQVLAVEVQALEQQLLGQGATQATAWNLRSSNATTLVLGSDTVNAHSFALNGNAILGRVAGDLAQFSFGGNTLFSAGYNAAFELAVAMGGMTVAFANSAANALTANRVQLDMLLKNLAGTFVIPGRIDALLTVSTVGNEQSQLLLKTLDGGAQQFVIGIIGKNLNLMNAGGTDFGAGVGVIKVANAGTDPTANPAGGGLLFASGGALKWRGPSGAVTVMGAA